MKGRKIMAFDGITVAALVQELKNVLSGGRIHKIAQPETDELLLTVRTPQGVKRLYISASASLPLVYLTEENKPSPMTAPGFCMLLRKHISSGRIVDISQPGLERVIQFDIEHLDELGDVCRKRLIVEIMGKHSNIIFCDSEGKIIDSIKHISAHTSSVREVLPGRAYFIPDTMSKQNPLYVLETDFSKILEGKPCHLAKAIYTSFTGISPVVAEEICFLCGIDSSIAYKELSDDTRRHLFRQFCIYFEAVKRGDFHPAVYYDGKSPKEFSCIPLTHLYPYERKEFTSVSSLLSAYYAQRNVISRIRQKSQDLRKIVQTILERSRKKYDLQKRQLKDTKNRDKYKIYGELITVYGYGLDPNAKVLKALNYYNNETVSIPLDASLTPLENAQRYFTKYNKQKRTYEVLSELIKETKSEIDYLESVSTALDIASNENDLAQIKEELAQGGFLRRRSTGAKIKIKNPPLHYLSSDGYHIYVGKNNYQNEEVTFHIAGADDWWFHAKGAPGSHVIVKSEGRELPDRVFEEAGKLAAYYSKNRGSDKVEIDYIKRRHIKKPSGGKPGFVIYHTNYSLVIDSDISGLQLIEP